MLCVAVLPCFAGGITTEFCVLIAWRGVADVLLHTSVVIGDQSSPESPVAAVFSLPVGVLFSVGQRGRREEGEERCRK